MELFINKAQLLFIGGNILSNNILSDLEPKSVFNYFEQICSIPHGSRNTKQISDFCVSFAKEHNLKYVQDESNNIIIWKDGTKGYENSPSVIIQGHLDMVCEKEHDCDIDFEKDGLSLIVDGDNIQTALLSVEMTELPLHSHLQSLTLQTFHIRQSRLYLR